ncbi:type II toxin-antitoxin system HipA family toxin, partial [Salmonella enterica subsp. enterica serovar Senftenberg]|nr:type II toxin-antitoxin system HipA family toxin [Salmonella enterica subsp. enterica serovar Senftenberg]
TGLSKQQTEAMIEEIIARTPGVIERVSGLLPDQFPQQLAESIFDGMRQQCRRLAEK